MDARIESLAHGREGWTALPRAMPASMANASPSHHAVHNMVEHDATPFLRKTFDIISSLEHASLIRWSDDGATFKIMDRKQFAQVSATLRSPP